MAQVLTQALALPDVPAFIRVDTYTLAVAVAQVSAAAVTAATELPTLHTSEKAFATAFEHTWAAELIPWALLFAQACA